MKSYRYYLFIARPDHWPKNVMVLPGFVFAAYICQIPPSCQMLLNLVMALASCCLVASANYVINEWLDSSFDKFHPTKKKRPGASGRLNGKLVCAEYLFLATAGCMLGARISLVFMGVSIFFLFMGAIYNVPPVRAKDRVYLDVFTESINNPLRFILGWLAYVSTVLPPSSILVAYWAGGGFLMAVKRYAEYRFIGDPQQASLYRKSFAKYTEEKLLLYSVFCAIVSSFFLAIFLLKYRIEFIILFPFISYMFVWYLAIGMRPLSPVQSPEKFFREKNFSRYIILLSLLAIVLAFVDIPELNILLEPVAVSSE